MWVRGIVADTPIAILPPDSVVDMTKPPRLSMRKYLTKLSPVVCEEVDIKCFLRIGRRGEQELRLFQIFNTVNVFVACFGTNGRHVYGFTAICENYLHPNRLMETTCTEGLIPEHLQRYICLMFRIRQASHHPPLTVHL